MFWKVEPLSPSGTPPPLDPIDDEWLCFDEKPALLEGFDEESPLYEENLTRAQVASKFLDELELKNWVKEESFADWFEEKIDLPIFEELPAPECGQNRAIIYQSGLKQQPQPQLVHHQQVDATQNLLREFETVLGDVEACHQITATVSTLTPPQSPPPINKQHLIVSLQPLHSAFVYEQQQHHQRHEKSAGIASSEQQQEQPGSYTVSGLSLSEPMIEQQIAEQWSAENLSLVPLVHGSDVAHELAKVDEYVRSCAEDVAAPCGSGCSSSSASSAPPSPCTSSNASCISSEDSADDPDWSYESTGCSSSSVSGRGRQISQSRQARRSKPYSRVNAEDKRVRKKEQNKNAATRYRQKKKQEIKTILGLSLIHI